MNFRFSSTHDLGFRYTSVISDSLAGSNYQYLINGASLSFRHGGAAPDILDCRSRLRFHEIMNVWLRRIQES